MDQRRMMERGFFNPDFARGLFSPSYSQPWILINQLDHITENLKNLPLSEKVTGAVNHNDKFEIDVDVQHFGPEEINVKVIDKFIVVEGKHEERFEEHGSVSRHFVRKYELPKGCLPDTVQARLSSDGLLAITAPMVLPMPSIGEKIIPITKTGPVRKQISDDQPSAYVNQ